MKVIKINTCEDCQYCTLSNDLENLNRPYCGLRSDWGQLDNYPNIPDDCPLEDDNIGGQGNER